MSKNSNTGTGAAYGDYINSCSIRLRNIKTSEAEKGKNNN